MTLGERICALRTNQNLSQSDLAERLQVSRQSVSKWETDSSVPDLDKLVGLCELFGVTMDQLVRGVDPGPAQPAPQTAVPPPAKPGGGLTARVMVGLMLLFFGFLTLILITAVFGDLLSGAVLSLPFLTCGVLCLTVRKHPALWCGWALWGMAAAYLRYATGIRLWWVFSPWLYRADMNVHALIAWGEVLPLLALLFFTGRAAWKWKKRGQTN